MLLQWVLEVQKLAQSMVAGPVLGPAAPDILMGVVCRDRLMGRSSGMAVRSVEELEDEAVGGVGLEEGREHQGLDGHQLDEDVEGGA